jgi:hypothetical protein
VREIRGGSIYFDRGSLGGNLFEVVFISDVRIYVCNTIHT